MLSTVVTKKKPPSPFSFLFLSLHFFSPLLLLSLPRCLLLGPRRRLAATGELATRFRCSFPSAGTSPELSLVGRRELSPVASSPARQLASRRTAQTERARERQSSLRAHARASSAATQSQRDREREKQDGKGRDRRRVPGPGRVMRRENAGGGQGGSLPLGAFSSFSPPSGKLLPDIGTVPTGIPSGVFSQVRFPKPSRRLGFVRLSL